MSGLPEEIKRKCEDILGTRIESSGSISGGDISESGMLIAGQKKFFIKYNAASHADEMFRTEVLGLQVLEQTKSVRTPTVIFSGNAGKFSFLLLEYITPSPPNVDFWNRFGTSLARLHKNTNSSFGLSHNNFIGSLPQLNGRSQSFSDFYIEMRLKPQVKMARDAQHFSSDDVALFESLYTRLDNLLPKDPPALIHGDLWSGNFLCDSQTQPVLIDPAISYSHREMDLAMTRLFGGFSPLFYQAYPESFPLEKGWEERSPLFQLYYLLVHVNLFGGSYIPSTLRIVKNF